MPRSLRMASLGILLSLIGCQQRSQLVVGIITNLRVKGDLTDVEMDVSRNGVIFQSYAWNISDQEALDFVLPGSFTFYSDNGGSPVTEIELRGLRGNQERVKRRSTMQLQSEQDLFYRMSLVQKCTSGSPSATENCPEGFSCAEGICKPEVIDSKMLTAWSDGRNDTLDCDSGEGFIDTGTCSDGTCDPMPIKGSCTDNQFCRDGTCYNKNPAAPQKLEFGELCRADQGETCRDSAYQCGQTPNGSGPARCRVRCPAIGSDAACNTPANRLPDGIAAMVATNRSRCIAANGLPPVCTFACDPFAGKEGGCLSGQTCYLITDGMSFLAPDCVPAPTSAPPALNQQCDSSRPGVCGQGATCLVPSGGPGPMGFCRALCTPDNTVPCAAGVTCQPLKVSMTAPASTEYGVCCPLNNCSA